MFLTITELRTAIYAYQLEQITEGDDSIILQAIAAATEEVKAYLRPNNKKEWNDGRLLYDVEAVFTALGTARNALLLEHTKTCAIWYIVRLCNVDMLHEHIKERYDRAIDWLKRVNKGDISLSLPLLIPNPNTDPNAEGKKPFATGSREKFNHE
jgi:phage gp36-like protein